MNIKLKIPEFPIVLNTRKEPEDDCFIESILPERRVMISYSKLRICGPYSFTDTEHGLKSAYTQWHGRHLFDGRAVWASICKQDDDYILTIDFIDDEKNDMWYLKVGPLTESDIIKSNVLIDRIKEHTRGKQYYTPEITCLPTYDILVYEKNRIVYVDNCCLLLEVAGGKQAFRINHEETEPKIASNLSDIRRY